jgi:hypothetical protein
VQDGDSFGQDAAGRKQRSRAALQVVEVILSHSLGEGVKAEEIVESVLRHPRLQKVLSDDAEDELEKEVKGDILHELIQSLATLSRSGNGSVKWHAYHTVLNAIVPPNCAHPAIIARVLEGSAGYRTVVKVSNRKQGIVDEDNWEIGHDRKTRSDAWSEMHEPTHGAAVRDWWENSDCVQCAPDVRYKSHRNCTRKLNQLTRRLECVDADPKCIEDKIIYQLFDDGSCWQNFKKDRPDIALTMCQTIFIGLRMENVKAMTSRSCDCTYHRNFAFAMEAYRKVAKALHPAGCSCDCEFCKSGRCQDHPSASTDKLMEYLLCSAKHGYLDKCVSASCNKCGWNHSDLDRCLGNVRAGDVGLLAAVGFKGGVVEWMVVETVKTSEGVAPARAGGDEDGDYGHPQAPTEKKEIRKVRHTGTVVQFMQYLQKLTREVFFHHRTKGKWQSGERGFDGCTTNLPFGHLAILLDYNMNYSHEHRLRAQGEHWCAHQTTLIPVVVYQRQRSPDGSEYVAAHSETFLSDDLNHSNQMVKHVAEVCIRKYTDGFGKVAETAPHFQYTGAGEKEAEHEEQEEHGQALCRPANKHAAAGSAGSPNRRKHARVSLQAPALPPPPMCLPCEQQGGCGEEAERPVTPVAAHAEVGVGAATPAATQSGARAEEEEGPVGRALDSQFAEQAEHGPPLKKKTVQEQREAQTARRAQKQQQKQERQQGGGEVRSQTGAEVASFLLHQKQRHTIMTRSIHNVSCGQVDHIKRPNVSEVKGLMSRFAYYPFTSEQEMQMVKGSCYSRECLDANTGCWEGNRSKCMFLEYTGPEVTKPVTATSGAAMRTREQYERDVLFPELKQKIKPGSNVLVAQTGGGWVIAKAVSGVGLMKDVGEGWGSVDHDGSKINWNETVVVVNQYEVKEKDIGGDPYKATFCLRTPSGECPNRWCDCGVGASPPCAKQHRQIYRLKQLRKPVNFKMVQTGTLERGGFKPSSADRGIIEYKLHSHAMQQVKQSLGALPWEGVAEGSGDGGCDCDAEPAADGKEGEYDAEYEAEQEYGGGADSAEPRGGADSGGCCDGRNGGSSGEGDGGGGSSGGGSSGGGDSGSGRKPTYVHMWSDGCAAQLKCRWQVEWLLNHGIEGVCIIHNYFQSCHGKGPSDSEGAVIKNHARHQEMVNQKEMNTTEELVADCKEHLQIDRLGPKQV